MTLVSDGCHSLPGLQAVFFYLIVQGSLRDFEMLSNKTLVAAAIVESFAYELAFKLFSCFFEA